MPDGDSHPDQPRQAPRRATIVEVARRAEVGIATVSRVLNQGSVSPVTRDRVLAAIEELGFQPMPTAQSLRRGSTRTLAVIAPFVTSPSVVERLRGVVAALRETPYELVLYDVETPEQWRDQLRGLANRGHVDGAIVISFPLSREDAELLAGADVPAVLLDAEHPSVPSFAIDDVAGGRLATSYLLELGHRQIGFVGDPSRNPFGFTSSARRLRGYRKALAEANLAVRPEYVKEGTHGRETAHELADALLALHRRPTAIFAASDTQALGVLEAASAAGIRVPDELSVVGFDDIEVAAYVGLTTVRQPLAESGKRAAELLLTRLATRGQRARRSRLGLELVVRQTTAPPAGS